MSFEWRERHVLVTGASGIVGSWLCERLLELEAYVVAFVRDDDPQSRFYSDGIARRCSIASGDIADFATLKRAMNDQETDVVFHLAAQTIVGSALRDPLECFESNIRGTYNLLEAARQLGPVVSNIVIASSDKAYGDSDVLPYTEEMPLKGNHPYDVSKSCTDLLAQTYANTYDMNVSIARCGNIYGAGDLNWSRIVPGTIRSLLNGFQPILRSDGSMIRDYIYVADVVSAYVLLAEHAARPEVRGGAFNFSPESEYTVLEIVDAISKEMGIAMKPLIQNTARAEIRKQTLDSTKAKKVLAWSCKYGLDSGLRETIQWYKRHLDITPAESAGKNNA